MAGESKTTTSHDKIKKWAEQRGGKPATVKQTTQKNKPGVLRFDFPGYRGKTTLEEISWDDFFAKFDESELAMIYQDKTATGKTSRFCKFISRKRSPAKATSH